MVPPIACLFAYLNDTALKPLLACSLSSLAPCRLVHKSQGVRFLYNKGVHCRLLYYLHKGPHFFLLPLPSGKVLLPAQ